MNEFTQAHQYFQGEGEIAALLRTHDWSASPLGPPDTWAQELHTVVGLMLVSKYPAVVAWGPDAIFLYNDAYRYMLAERHPSALGTPFREVWPELWDELGPVVGAALAGRPAYFEDVPVTLMHDGKPEPHWFTSSYSPVRDRHGKVLGMYNAGFETTSRVLAESRQRYQLELADRLRPLPDVDQIMAAAAQFLGSYYPQARVGYAELDERAQFVFMKADWSGGPLPSLSGHVLRFAAFGPQIATGLSSGAALALDDVRSDPRTGAVAAAYDAVGVRAMLAAPLIKDGRLRATLHVHLPQPYEWSALDIARAEDTVERTWSAAESARAQAELRAERDQSRYIFANMTDGFVLLDEDWTLLEVNEIAAQLCRVPRSDLLGSKQFDALPGLRGSPVEALYRRVRASGSAGKMEYLHTYPDGKRAWLEIRSYPLPMGRLAIFFSDVSERRQQEEALREAARRKDEFLAMLAHELRNPLAPIGAAAQLLQAAELDPRRVRKTSEVIGRQVEHMTHLINDLLDVSRVTRGLVELEVEALDLRDVVSDAVEQVAPIMHARGHLLALQAGAAPAMVCGDKKRLVQVITNLLHNAAKYTPEGGRIALTTELRPEHVLLHVTDNSQGMDQELVGRVFDLFSQARRSSDRSSGGLGLGLALVRSLVELHHGTVECESGGPGQGSRFTVCLPLLAAGARTPQPGQAATGDAGRPLRVLIVDDNVDAALMLSMLLQASGHEVAVEHQPHAALARVEREAPDVCLLDIGLPGMDGFELARRVRALPGAARTLLVAVTGYGQERDRERTLRAGFDHHLVKPIDTAVLGQILASAENA